MHQIYLHTLRYEPEDRMLYIDMTSYTGLGFIAMVYIVKPQSHGHTVRFPHSEALPASTCHELLEVARDSFTSPPIPPYIATHGCNLREEHAILAERHERYMLYLLSYLKVYSHLLQRASHPSSSLIGYHLHFFFFSSSFAPPPSSP